MKAKKPTKQHSSSISLRLVLSTGGNSHAYPAHQGLLGSTVCTHFPAQGEFRGLPSLGTRNEDAWARIQVAFSAFALLRKGLPCSRRSL
jgi:hypothetical protein